MKSWPLTLRRDSRLERITGNLIVLVAGLLACWAIWLASSLPPDPLTQHWSLTADIGLDNYSLTWVGLDCIEVLGLAACGLQFRRAAPSTRTFALLTLPVFLLDAWFDILTSVSKADLVAAVAMAVLGELPAACILGWLAWKAVAFLPEAGTGNCIRGGLALTGTGSGEVIRPAPSVRRAVPADGEAIRRLYAAAYRENREPGFPASAETGTTGEIAGCGSSGTRFGSRKPTA